MIKSRGSLRRKFILVVSSLLLLSFFSYGIITYRLVSKNIQENVTFGAINFSQLATKPIIENYEMYFDSGYIKFFDNFSKTLSKTTDVKRVVIVKVDGQILFDSQKAQVDQYPDQNEFVDPDIKTQLSSFEPVYTYSDSSKRYLNTIITPYITEWGGHPYSIIYYADYSEIKSLLFEVIIETAILAILFLILTALAIAIFTHSTILSPLSKIVETASKVAKGELGEQSNIKQKDEIGRLSKSINQITAELRQNITELEELDKLKGSFTDLIARNLKSPVKHIELDIDYVKSKLAKTTEEKVFAVLDDIDKSNNKLKLISEDLLNISSLKKGEVTKLIPSPINLLSIITETIAELDPEIKTKNLTVKFKTKISSAKTVADENKIRQTISNIIDNAIKYNRQNGRIDISLNKSNSEYVICVEDTGKGVKKEDLEKLFKPFNQTGSEESKSEKATREGTGLGLYLSKLIIEAHQGKINLESGYDSGTKVTFTLPIKSINQKELEKS